MGFFDHPEALTAVSQGITTTIVGVDGFAAHPLEGLFSRLEQSPVGVNVASYAGHNTIRAAVLEDDFRREATGDEVERMRRLLAPDMEAGALGLSTGLEYEPGLYSNTEEVIMLAREAGRQGGRYMSHMRSEDRSLEAAIEEIIRIGTEAEIPVQISHFKLAIRRLWGHADRIIKRLDKARAEGIQITADVYPYEYWQTILAIFQPAPDRDAREEIAFALEELVLPEALIMSHFEPEPTYVGKSIAEIAELRKTDSVTTYLDLLEESKEFRTFNEFAAVVIGTSMATEDVEALLSWQHSNVSTDGMLNDRHPRGIGTYPRILGHFVREKKVLSLETAVHKMTGLAAEHVGIQGRGSLQPGAFADLVLFDSDRVIDRATLDEPHLTSVGIERVWVNGVEVYADGKTTGNLPGMVVRRGD
jgi:N-acyl-D-amino-acid deacylase